MRNLIKAVPLLLSLSLINLVQADGPTKPKTDQEFKEFLKKQKAETAPIQTDVSFQEIKLEIKNLDTRTSKRLAILPGGNVSLGYTSSCFGIYKTKNYILNASQMEQLTKILEKANLGEISVEKLPPSKALFRGTQIRLTVSFMDNTKVSLTVHQDEYGIYQEQLKPLITHLVQIENRIISTTGSSEK